jgi:regulator of sigma E protease
MSMLNTVFAFLLAIALLVTVHEFGHFLAAKACGVRVLRFSLGFGKAIVCRRWGKDATEWVISAIPFGGYVKMLDEREGPVAESELPRAFNRKSVWLRAIIVAAGPVSNFLFAILVYWTLFIHGVPEAKPILDTPSASSLSAMQDIRRGDLVMKVNDQPVETWQDLRWQLIQSAIEKRNARLELVREGAGISWITLNLAQIEISDQDKDPVSAIGLRLYRPDFPPVIGGVTESSVAQKAGLSAGDRIIAVDGTPIGTWGAFVDFVRAKPGQTMLVELERSGAKLKLELTPEAVTLPGSKNPSGRVGAYAKPPQEAAGLVALVRRGPLESLRAALSKTYEMALFSLRMMGKMLVGDISPKNISGPISIADYAGQSAQMGVAPFLAFLALVSISLGVLNLLPVPLLDGGHLLYYTFEILVGRPLSEGAMEFGQRIGMALLMLLMVFAFYNDISRLVSG